MSRTRTILRRRRILLAAAYLLLWPPFLLLATRRSGEPAVFGFWSHRAFLLLVASVVILAGATVVVAGALRSDAWIRRIEHLARTLCRRKLTGVLAGGVPVFAWMVVFGIAGVIGVRPGISVVFGLASLTLLILFVEALFASLAKQDVAAPDDRHETITAAVVYSVGAVFLAATGLLVYQSGRAIRGGHLPTLLTIAFLAGWILVLLVGPAVMSRKAVRKLALLSVSGSISLYALEAGLRAFGPPVSSGTIATLRRAQRRELAKQQGRDFDDRPPLDVLLALRRSGTSIFPAGSFETYLQEASRWDHSRLFAESEAIRPVIRVGQSEVLPLGHVSNSTILDTGNENGYYATFSTDRHGFRNPAAVWDEPEIDVVGVGDSFTEGCHVQNGESFMSRIRRRYPRTVNLGLGGGGPFTMLACLREFGRTLKPKVVLWCFYEGNDLDDCLRRRNVPLVRRYLDKDFRQDLVNRQPEIDAALKRYFEESITRQRQATSGLRSWLPDRRQAETIVSVATWRKLRTTLGLAPGSGRWTYLWRGAVSPHWSRTVLAMSDDDYAVFRQVLERSRDEVHSWGGQLYFVYLPDFHRCAMPDFQQRTLHPTEQERRDDPRYRILKIASELNLNVIDVVPAIARHPDPLSLYPWRRFGHFNAAGYRFVGDAILEGLSRGPQDPLGRAAEAKQHRK